ncbi:nitric oxide synthase-interacting protein-like [Dreissena polymorpha]|uniref:Nitric oxide synthase-interacting protein zinc-finger domain-containing protein n=1 Tax=Dreissena polymorpha TaxID=45954 RepID=A0A9D4HSD1_DREPO|nr:nitric oxide synthase-interacting protein-like [Dreissena polymorpha]KAH3727663.1 hypothetical protein DPMN_053603 [Dreissena polymorpha]
MTRHSKNCTAGNVYSNHERKKDMLQSGYGSEKIRLGKDSAREFDCCCLTLQPCRNPVVTKDGYLYDKEALITYILQKKKEIARKLKEYEKQKEKQKAEAKEIKALEEQEKVRSFSSHTLQAPSVKQGTSGAGKSASISNMKEGTDKTLPSFWVPALTPDAKPKLEDKPDEKVRCPMSGKPIKLKDMIDVNFTHIKDGDSKTALISKQNRYVCAVTNDILGNSVPAAVLRTSGCVVTLDCVEKLIKKDMLDPINGKKMTEKDIIPLQRGASGFSGSGLSLEAKKEGAAMQA